MTEARYSLLGVLLVLSAACKPSPEYAVTALPLNLIGPGHPGHCIAIDLRQPPDVFIWEPAPSGCSQRTTEVRRPDRSFVTIGADGRTEVRFEIQLQVAGPREIHLALKDGVLRNTSSGTTVPTVKRPDLRVPDLTGQVR